MKSDETPDIKSAKTFGQLPEGCPLEGAKHINAEIYVVCNAIDDQSTSLKTMHERDLALNVRGDNLCKRYGLSMFMSLEACIQQRDLVPNLGRSIAKARLDENCGVVKETPSNKNPNHCTWWPYTDVDRPSLFKIIAGA